MATLRLIADRTGKPITYFLEAVDLAAGVRPGDERIEEIQRLVDQRQFEAAARHGIEILESLIASTDRAQIQALIGTAYISLRQTTVGLEYLRPAMHAFEGLGDKWMVVECRDWEAWAMELEHLPHALERELETLSLCRELDPMPQRTEARILTNLGRMYIHRTQYNDAVLALRQALEASTQLRDMRNMALINLNLGWCSSILGNVSEALLRTQKAMSLHALLGDKLAMAHTMNNLGLILMKQGDFPGSYRCLTDSLAHFEEAGVERTKSGTLLSLVEFHMARESLYEAEQSAKEAIALATRMTEHRNVALGHQYLGQIAAERQQHQTADAEFERSIEILEVNEAHQRAKDCRILYADILEARGELAAANAQLRIALNDERDRSRIQLSPVRSATA